MRAEILIRQRIWKLMIVLTALFGVITARIVSLAVVQGEELTARGVTGIFKGDNNSGYVVTASNKGYGGDVVVTVGFDTAGAILKVKADVSTETTGVGSKVGEDAVLNGFIGVTDNADNVKLRSGATYTSNAVRNSVNAAFDAVASVR